MIDNATRYTVDAAGCWRWDGYVQPNGYACTTRAGGIERYAHRYLWTLHRGPIPAGLVPDHLCRVRDCVNPDHMELVTNAENIRRGLRSYRMRHLCRAGLHDLRKPGAVYRWPSTGARTCRACMLANNRAAAARRRARQKELSHGLAA